MNKIFNLFLMNLRRILKKKDLFCWVKPVFIGGGLYYGYLFSGCYRSAHHRSHRPEIWNRPDSPVRKFLVNLEIGYSTPPIGMNLFISSIKFEKPVTLLYRASLPYLLLMLLFLVLITYRLPLSLFLLKLIPS